MGEWVYYNVKTDSEILRKKERLKDQMQIVKKIY